MPRPKGSLTEQDARTLARTRWENADPDAALAARRAAAAAVNGPAGLARRLAKRWPTATDDERVAALAELDPILDELLELAERVRP